MTHLAEHTKITITIKRKNNSVQILVALTYMLQLSFDWQLTQGYFLTYIVEDANKLLSSKSFEAGGILRFIDEIIQQRAAYC